MAARDTVRTRRRLTPGPPSPFRAAHARARAPLRAPSSRPPPRSVGFAQFFGWVGFVAIEGSLSLIVVREYGFTHQNVIEVWGPTSLAMLLGTVLFSQLHKAKCRAWRIAAIAIAVLPISFISLFSDYLGDGRVNVARYRHSQNLTAMIAVFVVGVGGLLFSFAVTNTLFNALLMQHLAPHQQATYQTPVQTLAAVGRGIGPFLGTLIIARGDECVQSRPSAGAACVPLAI